MLISVFYYTYKLRETIDLFLYSLNIILKYTMMSFNHLWFSRFSWDLTHCFGSRFGIWDFDVSGGRNLVVRKV